VRAACRGGQCGRRQIWRQTAVSSPRFGPAFPGALRARANFVFVERRRPAAAKCADFAGAAVNGRGPRAKCRKQRHTHLAGVSQLVRSYLLETCCRVECGRSLCFRRERGFVVLKARTDDIPLRYPLDLLTIAEILTVFDCRGTALTPACVGRRIGGGGARMRSYIRKCNQKVQDRLRQRYVCEQNLVL
jgi:hypothetical protein